MATSTQEAEAARQLRSRISDLDAERKRLDEALSKLGGESTSPAPRRRGPGRPKKQRGRPAKKAPGKAAGDSPAAAASAPAGAKPKRRRKRRGGTRADQAVKLITDKPGINASDVAKEMKIKPNYLYRVLGDLEKEGRVKKDGRQYFPAS